ncbi:MAG: 4Fe-4S binding protein [Syntrophobacteraceae bacterium]
MCQFCHQHGEGRRWYLRAEHYSETLLEDLDRRRYIKEFIRDVGNGHVSDLVSRFQQATRLPGWLRELGYWFREKEYRRDHFGQVVPLEDVERIFEIANSIVRMPCICRKNSTGRNDAHYCIGLGLNPEKLTDIRETFLETFQAGPHVPMFETLTREEALELHKGFERKGLIHTVWTFKTPFIGAICNCDRADCLAMVSYQYGFHIFFRGEYVARVQEDACTGCRSCSMSCQFGAIGYSTALRKAFIDPLRCYGCGICRPRCEHGAIALMNREEHPIAARLW